jgi:hypothetical protein
MLCLAALRMGRRLARGRRVAADAAVRELVGPLYHAEFVLPERRRPRFRRHHSSSSTRG